MNTLVGKRLKYPYDNMMGLGMMGVGKRTLPKDLLSSELLLAEGFESSAEWTAVNGVASDNTTEFVSGTQSVKTVPTAGLSMTVGKTVNIDFSQAEIIRFSIYIDPSTPVTAQMVYYLANNTNFANYYTYAFNQANFRTGWNKFNLLKSDFVVGGGAPTFANPILKVQVRNVAGVAEQPSMSLDRLESGKLAIPSVIFTFDDGYANQYTDAFLYMRNYKISGTVYVVTDWIGTGAYTTAAQLQEMDRAGWAIANHTTDHTTLIGLDEATQEIQLSGAKAALDALGLTKASNHVAYPSGVYNADTLTAMAATTMMTGRGGQARNNVLPNDSIYQLGARYITSSTSLATVTGLIDAAIIRGESIILMFHEIKTSPGANDWTPSDFHALVDYVNTKRSQIVPLTIEEWYRASLGSVVVDK